MRLNLEISTVTDYNITNLRNIVVNLRKSSLKDTQRCTNFAPFINFKIALSKMTHVKRGSCK